MRLLRAVGYVALFLLVQIIAGVLLDALGFSPNDVSGTDVHLRDVLVLGMLELLVLAGAVLFTHLRGGVRGLGVELRGARQARGWWQLAPSGLLVIAPSFAFALADDPSTVITRTSVATLAAFVGLAVLIGITEELWFRGLVMASLDPQRSPWLAVFGSAILFGLPHLLSSNAGVTAATALNAAAVTLAIAIPFACVRVASRAIVPMIGWHAAIDAWAFLHTSSITAEGTPDISDASVALVVPALVAAGYILWLNRRITQ
ncbi:MAG: CPBP family intramembrane glutamic endopeptidase [Gaiellales bacterium]